VNYNHAPFLPAAIAGLQAQTIPFDEIVVMDDASTDNSVALLEGLLKSLPQARLIKHAANQGVVDMMNAALAEVKSDFVYYFAADDTYNPHTVEWCEKLLARFPDVAMISGNARTVEVETGRERRFALPFPQEIGAYGAEDLKKAAQAAP